VRKKRARLGNNIVRAGRSEARIRYTHVAPEVRKTQYTALAYRRARKENCLTAKKYEALRTQETMSKEGQTLASGPKV
jgi:hypothetical protein